MSRADVLIFQTASSEVYLGAGTKHLVETPSGVLYQFYCNTAFDLYYKKSTDNGFTWSQIKLFKTGSVQGYALYADWWAGISGTLIHVWHTDDNVDDVFYNTLDTASDAVGTERTVVALTSAVSTGSHITGCIARGGYLFCHVCIDAGAEGGFYRSTDAGVTWTSVPPALGEPLATLDQFILLPGWNADANDVQMIFWDNSASEILVQRFDNSADTWSEALLSGSMTMYSASTAYPMFAAVADLANSRNVVAAWNIVDNAAGVLKCWTVDDTTETAKTDVVADSADDQGFAAITVDASGNWIVFYGGESGGSQVWASVKIYCKVSSDSGSTWGSETLLSSYTLTDPFTQTLRTLMAIPKAYTRTGADNPVSYYESTTPDKVSINVVIPTSGGSGGGLKIVGTGGLAG